MNATGTFELTEAATLFHLDSNDILEFIQNEWLQPKDPFEILFDQEDLNRLQFIIDLKNDFEANDQSIPIILHLVDQLKYLQLKILEAK